MKISVLLSLFQNENPDYFDLSIKSIWVDQTRKPDEIILVEDGPLTNDLYNCVKLWKDRIGSNFIVVTLNKNHGLAAALNEGIKHCSGDFIARMDTDDISLPNRFELQENFLVKNPDIVLLGGAMIEFSEIDGDLTPRKMPTNNEQIRKTICKTDPFVHPSVIINRKIFDAGLYYNPNCRRNQDTELWFRILAANYKCANLPDVIIKYRKDSNLYAKRNKTRGKEFVLYIKGISLLYGVFTWRYIYPFFHYLFRLLSPSLQNKIYKKFILNYWEKN